MGNVCPKYSKLFAIVVDALRRAQDWQMND
ncbi:hypothetical protein PAECIP111891_00818 [Paenibacillus allorhizoplanae]|uniref:Uncharacterized protein n=1 Tax=Paenibacillus allorhizoplanae TaxID=2905648 RepID=A0ABM9BYG6_9BACL|nr:hypothetical protein PAECIP111891_00818 [Paenibacillus allorhizoplanae]